MDGQAIKHFFAKHVEKIALIGVAGISGFLLYQGLQQPMYDKQEPDALASMATQVKQSVDEDHTAAIMEPRKVEADFVEQVAKSQTPVPAGAYETVHVWDPRPIDTSIKREDPQLLPPIELRVSGVVGALAFRSKAETYAAGELEYADPVEKEKPKPRRSSGRRGAMGSGSGGGEYGGYSPDSAGGSAEMGYGSGVMPGGAMAGGAMTPRRTLLPEYNQGYQPTGVVSGGMAASSGGSSAAASAPGVAAARNTTEPQLGHFIAGTAVMPHKLLVEAYEAALKEAVEYRPMRDQPKYLSFQVERADVTDKSVDQLQPGDWKYRANSRDYNTLARLYWAGFAPEIVPGDYRDPVLTSVIPPLLINDYTDFSLHPLIPLQSMAELQRAAMPVDRGPVVPDAPFLPGQETDILSDPAALLRGMGAAAGGYAGGYSGSAGGYSGGSYSGSAGGYSGGGYSGGGYSGAYGSTANQNPPEYKLIRFYDFASNRDPNSPVPGRQYVYRVRVALEDPNFPMMATNQPTLRSLSPDAFQRVALKQAAVEAKKTDTNKTPTRDYVLWTDWSAPSPRAELPPLAATYAGPVEPARTRGMTIGTRQIEYVITPAKAKMVAIQWSPQYAAAVPAPMNDVMIGSVLNTEAPLTAEVVDPLTATIKKLPDAQVHTNAVVLDITGGDKLQFVDEEEQTRPGMMLVFAPDGSLKVRDEIADRREFRMHTYADERETPSATVPGGGYDAGGGGYSGGYSGGGYGAP